MEAQVEAGQLVDRSNRRQQDHGAAQSLQPVLAETDPRLPAGAPLVGLAHGDSYSPQMARRGKGFISRRMRAMTRVRGDRALSNEPSGRTRRRGPLRALAAAEADPVRKDLFLQLSQAEAEHAKL